MIGIDEYLDDIHVRILRVTEDLRIIQRELNCAAMEAPADPAMMEALTRPPELDSLQVLKSALDQMRHFLWFYLQIMNSESELGEKMRQSIAQKTSGDMTMNAEINLLERFKQATDVALMHHLADGKMRKPN